MIYGVEENEREGRWKREDKEWSLLKRPDGRETRLLEYNDDRIWNENEKEMRGRCKTKWSEGGQMIKHSRWKGCERVGVESKNRKMMELSQKAMKWDVEIKRFERDETGEDIKREGGEMVRIKTWRRKWNEETRKWIEEIIQDLSRKWDHQTHHHQETQ